MRSEGCHAHCPTVDIASSEALEAAIWPASGLKDRKPKPIHLHHIRSRSASGGYKCRLLYNMLTQRLLASAGRIATCVLITTGQDTSHAHVHAHVTQQYSCPPLAPHCTQARHSHAIKDVDMPCHNTAGNSMCVGAWPHMCVALRGQEEEPERGHSTV